MLVALSLPVSAAPGCGGGGTPAAAPRCATFTPAAMPAAGTVTTESDLSSTCDIVKLNVMVTGVDNVWSAGFKVRYPSNLLTFLDADDTNSILGKDGTPLDTLLVLPPIPVPGTDFSEVTVGITRSSSTAPGVNIGATPELLIQLLFSRGSGTGSGSITYLNEKLEDAQSPPQTIPGIVWSGGTVIVN